MAKKKLIALAFSDLHLHEWNEFNKKNARVISACEVVIKIENKARKKNVPVLFTGDLVHNPKHITNRLLHIILYLFKHLSVDIYGIDGNHDQCEQNTLDHKSPSYFNTFSEVFDNLHCVNFKSIELDEFVIHGIPYLTHNIGFEEAVKKIKLNKNKPNILMIHTDLHNAKDTNGRMVGTVTNIPQNMNKFFKKFTLVISGHIHKPQKLGKNILMLGAPQQQRRTDKGSELGYWNIYSDGSFRFKKLKSPVFKTGEPDGYNFCDPVKKRKLTRENKQTLEFDTSKSRNKLARGYCKENDISDKEKINALKKYLNNA